MLAVRIILGSASLAGVLTTLTLVKPSSAQTDASTAISKPGDFPESATPDVQPANVDDSALAGVEEVAPSGDANIDQEQPPDTDLERGLPLTILLTPFHWGRLSLLSLTASQGYNSNPEFQRNPLGSWVTTISSLALYSAQFSGWRMNLQYQPFVWISSRRTLKNFAAASFDIRTLRHISGNWHWTLGDRLRYSPTHSTEQGKGFVADPGGGFSIGNAFLSSGRNVLVNGIVATLTDHYNENSTLTFHANQDYTRLSSYLGTQPDSLPAQEAITFSTGATWRRHLGLKDTFSMEYVYRLQATTGTSVADVNSQTASAGWTHKLTPSLGVSAAVGPAWSIYAGRENASHGRTTLHGSLALSKEFRKGGVVLAFARSDSFTGIISDSFHNRYDLTVHREFNTRLNCSATASYIQQQFSNARSTKGELAAAEVRYFLTRNWAAFAQVRYLDLVGNERILAPEKSAIVGFRWFWVPEKP